MSTNVDTAPPAWRDYQNWPETLGAVDPNSQIGRLQREAAELRRRVVEKNTEVGRLRRDAEALDAVVRDATPATPWERVAQAVTMAPIYRREAERLASEAHPLETEAGRIANAIQDMWIAYTRALGEWKRDPANVAPRRAAVLASYVWPQ